MIYYISSWTYNMQFPALFKIYFQNGWRMARFLKGKQKRWTWVETLCRCYKKAYAAGVNILIFSYELIMYI